MTRGLTLLFAITGGAAVGNLYWAQPLLEEIGGEFGVGSPGWLVTATQLGYATGILLVVPLGDVRERRRLITGMLLLGSVALVACGLAPSFPLLVVAMVALGLCTVSGQLLTPLAGDLAAPEHRGRVVGTVVSGLLTGILVSRTLSGLLAGATSWHVVYLAAAGLDLVLAALLWRALPPQPARQHLPYRSLLGSVFAVVARERVVRWTIGLGALSFGLFTMFWTALTFLLSAPPFSLPVGVIGLFGLAGLAGAVAAQRSGRLHDRGLSLPATGIGWAVVLLSFAAVALLPPSIAVVLAVVVVLDVAVQTVNILNQARVFAVSARARSRLNTAYIVGNFLGGAAGSALASALWAAGGWRWVGLAGVVGSGAALALWAVGRRSALRIGTGGTGDRD